jgi:hypothetical protein
MYAKTRPTATGALSRKQKRIFAIVGVVVILALAGSRLRERDPAEFHRRVHAALLRRSGPGVL